MGKNKKRGAVRDGLGGTECRPAAFGRLYLRQKINTAALAPANDLGRGEIDLPEDGLIILTGGAGFIGSGFLGHLNDQGEKNILVVDHDNSPVKMANLAEKSFTDYQEKDVFIRQIERGACTKKVKAIFHIGACSSTLVTDAAYLLENNTRYSEILVKWALDNQLPFFYASSAAIYGNGRLGYSDEAVLVPKLQPLNLYAQSKQRFDLWLLENGLVDKVVGFRYFNVFGPNEYHKGEMRSLALKAYEQIKRDGRIRLFKSYLSQYKDGEQKRDFIYIKDAIAVMDWFYRHRQVKGIYNVGTGRARTWNDLARAIFVALGLTPSIEYIEMPQTIKDKYQYFTQADLAQLRDVGCRPECYSLEAAVADYVKNYLEKGLARL
ncbi:ADP-glyceromanno-heptose 6-epimerase [Candidatus Saganbacteria bacterium]|nr:ADP-glyceromanno-heptose 6-epimerase [Candidatus Saganbacteria bacterium]